MIDRQLLQELYDKQRSHIDYFFDTIDLACVEKLLVELYDHKGLVVFTGVGKSGLVAEKIAMTCSSTGTKAIFLPPHNFPHGDIAVLSEGDLVIMLSKSGETSELLDLIPMIKQRKAKVISLVSNPHSRLSSDADSTIHLPLEKELCPFDLAPTTSTAIQLIFGDILAVALMRKKSFSLDEYMRNHPSGSIGKKMTVRVNDLMVKGENIPICRKKERLVDLLVTLSNKKCGCLLVVDEEDQLEGIFTDGDLRRCLQRHGSEILYWRIEKLMTRSITSITPGVLVWEAMKQMQKDPKKWVMMLPVVEEGKISGLLRMHDIIQEGISG